MVEGDVEFRQHPHLCTAPGIVEMMVVDHGVAVGVRCIAAPSGRHLVVVVAVEVFAVGDVGNGGRDEAVGLAGVAAQGIDEINVVVCLW